MENRTGLGDGMGGKGDGTQDSPNREESKNPKVIVYSCIYVRIKGLIKLTNPSPLFCIWATTFKAVT